MTIIRHLSIVAVLLAGVCGTQAAEIPAVGVEAAQAHIVSRAVDGYIRPAFARFADAGATLQRDIDGFCSAPSIEGHDAVAASYRAALQGFAGVQFLRFGPLLQDHRLERLVFWPDRKSTGRRQAERIVKQHDDSVLSLDSLRIKSVAVQGLSALEVTLFNGARKSLLAGGADGKFRCAYARVIAENVVEITAHLRDEWADQQGYAAILTKPGAKNATYRSHQEAAAEIVGSLTTGLQIIRDQQLLPVISTEIKKARPKRALFRRSGDTVAILSAGTKGLHDMVVALDLDSVLGEDDAWLANSIPFELSNALRVLDDVPEPLTKTLKDPGVYGKLSYVNLVLADLRSTVGEGLAAALAILMGFNALDGD